MKKKNETISLKLQKQENTSLEVLPNQLDK